MLNIPDNILVQYKEILNKKVLDVSVHWDYIKWLRYFLDFCSKYITTDSRSEQVRLFIEKLREKKQTPYQQKQAAYAVSLYFEMQRNLNHKTPQARVNSEIASSLVKSINRRHNRVGHVLQGRFKSILVDRESHFLELCRYVVLNPVRVKIINLVHQYKWSSYRATAGLEDEPDFLAVDEVLSQFNPKRDEAVMAYREFVDAGIEASSPWEDLKGQCILGGKEFQDRLKPAIKDKSALKEITRAERFALSPSLKDIFIEANEMGKRKRNELIRKAYREYGYTLSEIGRYLGLHYTTISNIIKRD